MSTIPTQGDDTLDGASDAPDTLSGLAGDDLILGNGSGLGDTDQLSGDAGNDTLIGGEGSNVLTGGDGNDSIQAGASGVTTGAGGAGNDTLLGGAGADFLAGDAYDIGGGGSTVAGADVLAGGAGNDILSGGPGDDILDPGTADVGGADLVLGGIGIDTLVLPGQPADYGFSVIGPSFLVTSAAGVNVEVDGVERVAFGPTALELAAGATPLTVANFGSLFPNSSSSGVGLPPIALSDTIGAARGATRVLINLRDILENDYDPDGNPQDLTSIVTTTPAGASTAALLSATDIIAGGFNPTLYPLGLLVVDIPGGLTTPIKLQYRTVWQDSASSALDTSSEATITINPAQAVNDFVRGSLGGETFIPYATLLANDGPGAVFGGISNAFVPGGTIVNDPVRGGLVIDFPGLFPGAASFEYSLVGFAQTAFVQVDLSNSPPITTPIARVVTPGSSFSLSFDDIRFKPGNFDPDDTGQPTLVSVSGAATSDVTYSLSATGIDLTFASTYAGDFSLQYTLTDQPPLARSLPATISFILAAPPAPVTVNEVLNWGINSDGRTLFQGGFPGFGEIFARELLANDAVMPGTIVGTSIDDTTIETANLAIKSIRYGVPGFNGVTSRSDTAFGFEFEDNFTGSETYRYSIYDPLGRNTTGEVTLNVTIPQPVLTNNVIAVAPGATSVTVTAAEILGNDSFSGAGTGAIAQINANAVITVADSGVDIGAGKTRIDSFTFALDPARTLDTYQFNILTFDTAAAGGSASGFQTVTFATGAPTSYRFADPSDTVTEGTSTISDNGFAFRIERTGVLDEAVVFYTLRPALSGASADGSDVRSAFGTQLQYQFSAGQAAVNLGISIVGDAVVEPDESFRVTLDSVGGVAGGGNSGVIDPAASVFVATILDDDLPPPVFTVAPVNAFITEGTAPGLGGFIQFVVTRSGDLSAPATISYAAGPGATNGASADDFGGATFPSGSFTIPANVAQGFIGFSANADGLDEPDATVTLTLTATSFGTIGAQSSATVTILDDDDAPPNRPPTDIALDNASVRENLPIGTLVGQLSATDPDVGDSRTFSFAPGGNPGGLFSIIGNTLRTAAVLDYEAAATRTVTLRVTDRAGSTYDEAFTIAIGDVSEGPTNGDDFITGTPAPDAINALRGNDTVLGLADADTLDGAQGNDSLRGDGGDDSLAGGSGDDTLDGGDGNDLLAGGSGENSLVGGDGADTIEGGSGFDWINGDAGNDLLFGNGGNDDIRGGDGNDTLRGGAGINQLSGDDGDDLLFAGDRGVLFGGADRDTLVGGADNDFLNGEGGDDSITGASGHDTILGEAGDDTIRAGQGDDSVEAGSGADNVDGDNGDDTVTGDAGNDTLRGDQGADSLLGGDGLDILEGGNGNDTLAGGNDADSIAGGIANDALAGDAGDDTLRGDQGDDTADGGTGADLLFGGAGADSLYGGFASGGLSTEADTLIGGAGADTLEGGDDYGVFSGFTTNGNGVPTGGIFTAGDRIDLRAPSGRGDGAADVVIYGTRSNAFGFAEDDGFDQVLGFEAGLDRILVTGTFGGGAPVLTPTLTVAGGSTFVTFVSVNGPQFGAGLVIEGVTGLTAAFVTTATSSDWIIT